MPKGDPRFDPQIEYELRRWQADDDLAGVREAGALAKLPESEREMWQKLWADVDAFVKELAKLAHTPLVTT
jgi:hypothetical protein